MRLLYLLLFSTVMFSMQVLAGEKSVHKKVPLETAVPLLKSIEDYAMHMGRGARDVHIFVDPLCPHSQNLIEMISTSEKALSRNSYSIYLYTLKRLHSEQSVLAIYSSEDPLSSMLTVMVDKENVTAHDTSKDEVITEIEAIAKVAEELDVYKRPYLIFVKKPKKERGQ